MVELKAQVQEALGVGRDVGGYGGLRAKRTNLHHEDVSTNEGKRGVRMMRCENHTLKMACIWLS